MGVGGRLRLRNHRLRVLEFAVCEEQRGDLGVRIWRRFQGVNVAADAVAERVKNGFESVWHGVYHSGSGVEIGIGSFSKIEWGVLLRGASQAR